MKLNNILPKITVSDKTYKPKQSELLIKINGNIIDNIDYLIKTTTAHIEYETVVQGYIKKIDLPLLSIINIKKVIISTENNKKEFES